MSSAEKSAYMYFINEFKLFADSNPEVLLNTLSNIFSMRIIGNKTHGDLAEIAISEFINIFLNDKFSCLHVGKDLYRKKEHEEDILITCLVGEFKGQKIPVSLKAYGNGPLQLSTDKESKLFSLLQVCGKDIKKEHEISKIINSSEFQAVSQVNIIPLIYDETERVCNILVFDIDKAFKSTKRIVFIDKNKGYNPKTGQVEQVNGRKHPIYMFLDEKGNYICEVRYGGASANALQRGFWTHTINAVNYFNSLTNGWTNYTENNDLVELIALSLNAPNYVHKKINELLIENIRGIKIG